MCKYSYFICPIEYNESLGRMSMECEPSLIFRPSEYTLPVSVYAILRIVSLYKLKKKKLIKIKQ